jgi:hypothetical protein
VALKSGLVLSGPNGVETFELAHIEKCESMGKKVMLRRKQSRQNREEGAAEEGLKQEGESGGKTEGQEEQENERERKEQEQEEGTPKKASRTVLPDLLHLRMKYVTEAEAWAAAISSGQVRARLQVHRARVARRVRQRC